VTAGQRARARAGCGRESRWSDGYTAENNASRAGWKGGLVVAIAVGTAACTYRDSWRANPRSEVSKAVLLQRVTRPKKMN